MKCKKGKKVIEVSEKAFRVVYQPQGYKNVNEEKAKPCKDAEEKKIPLFDMSVQELKEVAQKKGLEGVESLNKEELLLVLEGDS